MQLACVPFCSFVGDTLAARPPSPVEVLQSLRMRHGLLFSGIVLILYSQTPHNGCQRHSICVCLVELQTGVSLL